MSWEKINVILYYKNGFVLDQKKDSPLTCSSWCSLPSHLILIFTSWKQIYWSCLNFWAYSDKRRVYTIPESLAVHQALGFPAAASVVPEVGYASPFQSSVATVSSWDPAMHTGRPNFVSGPVTFLGQVYASTSVTAYSTATIPPGSSPLPQTNHISLVALLCTNQMCCLVVFQHHVDLLTMLHELHLFRTNFFLMHNKGPYLLPP